MSIPRKRAMPRSTGISTTQARRTPKRCASGGTVGRGAPASRTRRPFAGTCQAAQAGVGGVGIGDVGGEPSFLWIENDGAAVADGGPDDELRRRRSQAHLVAHRLGELMRFLGGEVHPPAPARDAPA